MIFSIRLTWEKCESIKDSFSRNSWGKKWYNNRLLQSSSRLMFIPQCSRFILGKPRLVLFLVAVLLLFSGYFLKDFRLDASADSLVVEGDPDLEYSREINARYATRDFVFVVYTPTAALFSSPVLADLALLRDQLLSTGNVESVDTILDLPLLKVANASLADVANTLLTLETPGVDLAAARADLLSNEAYRDVLLSEDGLTTSLIVNFKPDMRAQELLAERTTLRNKTATAPLDRDEADRLAQVENEYRSIQANGSQQLHEDIEAIRTILATHAGVADIHMGGVPMIADDLVSFVRNDIETFGVVILLFIILALALLFRKVRFVVLPLVSCVVIAVTVSGLLGLFKWPVTVISSNFISLLLIISVSLTVHLIVRFRELEQFAPELGYAEQLRQVLQSMFVPCAYTSLTTLVAFASLLVSDIPPIIDFGWMMVIGVTMAFVLSFLVFPALMALLPAPTPSSTGNGLDLTPWLAGFTERHGRAIMVASLLLAIGTLAGMYRLKVENSFIDYFDESTEIYQGMQTIDSRMGGTTPLDVIIDLGPAVPLPQFGDDPFADEEDFFGEEEEEAGDPDAYWFTSDKMQNIVAIHRYLDSLPETGKVLSLATLLNLAYELNGGQALNSIELGILYNRIPADYKESLLRPYVSVADNQVRFSLRIRESDPGLVRNRLLQQIRQGLEEGFGLAPAQVHLTGMLVLYNNMLQSLFKSQILTLSLVMGMIFIMFIILFRSLSLAVLGIIPNLLAALSVLGLMGWLDIPLDMMTITIASISVGIGVDNTIHYIHRFQHFFPQSGNYRATMHYCHGSIGKAMYYTSFTIVAGFSILVLSNFVPTVRFGLLTSMAMLLALAGALTLLPQLLLVFKPLGPGKPLAQA
jgi:predicted RND superfamily exporter protein